MRGYYVSIDIVKGTSQNNCAFESPTFFTDELLNMTSLLEFVLKPRAHVPTTRQTPSGFRPPLICKIIEHDNRKKLQEKVLILILSRYLFH